MTVVLASVRFSRQWQILITSLKHVGITDTSLTLHHCMYVEARYDLLSLH